MKTVVIGSRGQLGSDILEYLGQEAIGLTHDDIQVESLASVRAALYPLKPELVINTAAFLDVPRCEVEPERAYLINALGASHVAQVCREMGASVAYLSTDYVFSGAKGSPYTEFDAPDPLNEYGRSKAAGEILVGEQNPNHFIIRVSGLLGARGSLMKGGNFIEKILKQAEEKKSLRVVADQVFQPTFTADIAPLIMKIAEAGSYGTYHLTNQGACSWYDLAAEAVRLAGLDAEVEAVSAADFPSPVRRPDYSVLDNYRMKLQGMELASGWQAGLMRYMERRKAQN